MRILFSFRRLAAICLCLSACTQAEDSASNVGATAKNEANASAQKMGEIFGTRKKPVEKRLPADERYCYRTYSDIICYAQPVPGEEYRLVGYQRSNGKTGYIVQPSRFMDGDSAALPALRQVTVGAPPAVLGTNADGSPAPHALREVIFDPAELEPKTLVPEKAQ